MKIFKDWCLQNNRMEILKLYENADNLKASDQIGFSSGKKVWWKCLKCGLSWEQSPNRMIKKKNEGCPFCNRSHPSYFYNLALLYPELAIEWDYDKNDRLPEEYLPNSSKKVFWKCQYNHCWDSIISDRVESLKKCRVSKRSVCPYCNHERISPTYNLVTEFPNIAKQWNYIKNRDLVPLNISPKSQKKVWWICEYNPNHIWQDKIANRTVLNRGCPICSKNHISFMARVLFYYLKQYFTDCEIEYNLIGHYVADIYIPSYKIVIEYDGWFFHGTLESKKREAKKDKALTEAGYQLIRIKESKTFRSDIIVGENQITYYKYDDLRNVNALIDCVCTLIGHKINRNINIKSNIINDYQKIENLYFHVRKSNSLAVQRPDLAKEWSPNNTILLDNVTPKLNYRAKWICPKCQNEYETLIRNRAILNSACPYCANLKVYKHNSLAYVFPDIAKEWDYEKNGTLTPNDITRGCDKKVWWKCDKGHSWQSRVYSRTGKDKTNCPYCSHRKLILENSLEIRNPELVKYWNYEKNNKLPSDYSYCSNKKVWWKCESGHIWQQSINVLQRIKSKNKCPYCRNIKVTDTNSLEAIYPDLCDYWDYEKNSALKPNDVRANSYSKYWWICEKGHSWQAQIIRRKHNKECPVCKKISNSFMAKRPNLLIEWDYKKNKEVSPEFISEYSGKNVWWKCQNGHSWKDTVSHRICGRGCPYCSGRRASSTNNLAIQFPNIASEWDYEKNGDLKPKNVTSCSGKKVWWKCQNGHVWQTSISNRKRGTNCPKCFELKRKKLIFEKV